ncbi:MAG: DUF4911 domain-containing protein [Desulfatiglandaceae bacterium]
MTRNIPFKTTSRMLRVPRWAICYIRYTVESYDGIAVVSTLDPKQGTLHIQVAPGCEDILDDLIAYMSENENIPIYRIGGGRVCMVNPANAFSEAEGESS